MVTIQCAFIMTVYHLTIEIYLSFCMLYVMLMFSLSMVTLSLHTVMILQSRLSTRVWKVVEK